MVVKGGAVRPTGGAVSLGNVTQEPVRVAGPVKRDAQPDCSAISGLPQGQGQNDFDRYFLEDIRDR